MATENTAKMTTWHFYRPFTLKTFEALLINDVLKVGFVTMS